MTYKLPKLRNIKKSRCTRIRLIGHDKMDGGESAQHILVSHLRKPPVPASPPTFPCIEWTDLWTASAFDETSRRTAEVVTIATGGSLVPAFTGVRGTISAILVRNSNFSPCFFVVVYFTYSLFASQSRQLGISVSTTAEKKEQITLIDAYSLVHVYVTRTCAIFL